MTTSVALSSGPIHWGLDTSKKNLKIKQYHKLGAALRTETTINDSYDFGIGRGLHNLAALRQVGFAANRRLLDVQPTSHDPFIGAERLAEVSAPVVVDGDRNADLRIRLAGRHCTPTAGMTCICTPGCRKSLEHLCRLPP